MLASLQSMSSQESAFSKTLSKADHCGCFHSQQTPFGESKELQSHAESFQEITEIVSPLRTTGNRDEKGSSSAITTLSGIAVLFIK